MLFVSNDLPCRSHRKPCTLQDRLGPPRMIASLALQDRLAGAIASLESWVWVGGFCKIGSRLWVGFNSLKWFYGHRYELIGVALAYGCGLIDLVGLWFGFGWVWFVVGRWWRRWWWVFFFFFGCGWWWWVDVDMEVEVKRWNLSFLYEKVFVSMFCWWSFLSKIELNLNEFWIISEFWEMGIFVFV